MCLHPSKCVKFKDSKLTNEPNIIMKIVSSNQEKDPCHTFLTTNNQTKTFDIVLILSRFVVTEQFITHMQSK